MSLVVAAVVVGLFMVWTAAVLAASRYGDRKVLARRRVIVNLRSGQAVEGVVTHFGPEVVIVADAQVYESGTTSPVPAVGDIVLDRSNVAFTQRREAVKA